MPPRRRGNRRGNANQQPQQSHNDENNPNHDDHRNSAEFFSAEEDEEVRQHPEQHEEPQQEQPQQQQDEHEPEQPEEQQQEAPQEQEHEPQQPQQSTPAALLSDRLASAVSVLSDEEDSYRLICEHDEHLARIRAYTDFFDKWHAMKKRQQQHQQQQQQPTPAAAPGEHEEDETESHQTLSETPASGGAPASAQVEPSADRTPTELGDLGLRSESGQRTPYQSPEREDLVSRLEAEKVRLAQELLASQATVQLLQTSLREAREAAEQQDAEAVAAALREATQSNGAAAPHATAEPTESRDRSSDDGEGDSVSSMTNSVTRELGATPTQDPVVPTSPLAADASADMMKEQTEAFLPSAPPHHPQQQALSRHSSRSPGRAGGRATPLQHQQPRPVDISEFFWSLQVAPPPSVLHTNCSFDDRCHSPPPTAAAGDGTGDSYGATGTRTSLTAPRPLSQWMAGGEQEAALACESAWVDSTYYCYNIMEEMSCLRVVRSPDELVDEDGHSLANGSGLLTEDEMTRRLLDRTPATGMSPVTSPAAQSIQVQVPWPPSGGNNSGAGRAGVAADTPLMNYSGAGSQLQQHSESQRFRLPFLQRLWVTASLRQYLLFHLLTIACVLLMIPSMILATVDVFEAAEGEDFYSTRNRFGRSALLVVARLGSCNFVFLVFFAVVFAEGGRRQLPKTASQASVSEVSESAAGAGGSTARKLSHPTTLGTVVHLALCAGAVALFIGSLLFQHGCQQRNLFVSLLGMALFGGGEALMLGALGTIISAEIGVAAGVNVGLQILMSTWLLVNAIGAFVFPKLTYFAYTPAQLLHTQAFATLFIGATVFGLIMLCPRDLIERAGQANARFISPRKLLSAARHDVSFCFYLRGLTVGLLTAVMMLCMSAGPAIFVPAQAETISMAESAKTRQLMGTGTGKRSTAATTTDAGVIAASTDRWASQERHASAFLFAFALLAVPLCFIPRSASFINRWCPVALLTTLLCLMWAASTASTWVLVLNGNSAMAASINSSLKRSEKVWQVWVWLGKHQYYNPSMQLCGAVTGIVFTIVVSSLLRSIANAGVQLPVMHPARWRMAFHERDRRALKHATSSSSTSEALPLLSADKAAKHRKAAGKKENLDAAAEEAERPSSSADAHLLEEHMRCVRMQLRGGPAVMTVLVCLLIMIVLLACVSVMTVAAALLTDRDEHPLYVGPVMPGVSWDDHLVAKTVLTCVLGLAMLVQWVEVIHRCCCFCCSCCCCC